MKKTKLLSFVMAVIMCVSLLASVAQAASASTYNNNTLRTSTAFNIRDNGQADVYTSYTGWEDVMTEATITITIKKRSFLLFWNEVTTHTLYSTEIEYANTYTYQLSSSGTYKCEVEYVISGTGGEDDVITFEDTASY